jgi:heme-degrading monooxygenase HmoA
MAGKLDPSVSQDRVQNSGPPSAGPPAFIALSRFTVANGMVDEVKTAFANRPHLVDGAPGFLRMEVMSPQEDPREIWLLTWWRDEQSFRSWHRGHLYHEAHRGIPKGLKLVPGSAQLRCFDLVCT